MVCSRPWARRNACPVRLGDLDDDEAARAAQFAGAQDGAVGPFDGLHRQHRLFLDGHALADVEPAHLARQPPAELRCPFRSAAADRAGEYTWDTSNSGQRSRADSICMPSAANSSIIASIRLSSLLFAALAMVPETQCPPVGPQAQPPGWCMRALWILPAMTTRSTPFALEAADHSAEASDARPVESVHLFRKRGIGITANAHANDAAAQGSGPFRRTASGTGPSRPAAQLVSWPLSSLPPDPSAA